MASMLEVFTILINIKVNQTITNAPFAVIRLSSRIQKTTSTCDCIVRGLSC